MATISRNFRGAVVEPDGSSIRVDGTSSVTEADGSVHPFSEHPDQTEMFITIMMPPSGQPRVAKAHLEGGDAWEALFMDAVPLAPQDGPAATHVVSVRMIGLALTPGQDPYVWEATKPLTHR
jgi:hypothetical protein